jgi:hypothetical protein
MGVELPIALLVDLAAGTLDRSIDGTWVFGRNLGIVTPIQSSPLRHTEPRKYFVSGYRRPQDPDVVAIALNRAGPIESDVVVPLGSVRRSLHPDDAHVITSSRRARTTVDLLLPSTPRLG